jgi:hypothetical protein
MRQTRSWRARHDARKEAPEKELSMKDDKPLKTLRLVKQTVKTVKVRTGVQAGVSVGVTVPPR